MRKTNKILNSPLIVILVLVLVIVSCEKLDTRPAPIIVEVTDIDGNDYNVVRIHGQYWMKENLKVTRYNNGDSIGTTTPATKEITNEIDPKYQWPAYGDEKNVETFGRIYTWYAASDSRKLCPTGWHIPSQTEWAVLAYFFGGIDSAGGKLKEVGTSHWNYPNTGATNESGFSAIPGGYRNPNGVFTGKPGRYDVWWSSTQTSATKALHWGVGYIYSYFYNIEEFKSQAIAVRCIKDR